MTHTKEEYIRVECARIAFSVAEAFGINYDEMISKSRKRELVIGRQFTAFCARKKILIENVFSNNKAPLRIIGESVGSKGHCMVLHSIKQINDKLSVKDKIYTRAMESVQHLLNPLFDQDILRMAERMPQLGSAYKYD